MDNAGALPTYPQRSSNQRDQINRTIDESRLSANNPIASGTGPGGDIMSESRGEIISVRRGDFFGIRKLTSAHGDFSARSGPKSQIFGAR